MVLLLTKFSEPCLIELRAETPIQENCHGDTTYAGGTVWVSGLKRTEGWLTGHPRRSIVPNKANATTYALTMQFENFSWAHPGWTTLTFVRVKCR